MALKLFQVLSFISLVFLVLSATIQAKREMPTDKKPSPFEFITKLQGCQKGTKTKGINQLKTYLHEFGYLEYANKTHANDDDDFDDALEFAIKTYQQNYHIEPTGMLDATTVSKMITPRCGVPDIVNGTNSMQRKNKKTHDSSSSSIHTVSHYSFLSGNPRWPRTKRHLTYGFLPNTNPDTMAPVARAFQKWASVSPFTFSRAGNYRNADLVIGFHRRDHGDGYPFEGPGGIIAHAFPPVDGRFHYDADERWSIGRVPNAFDLETVALHEIGHLLGLGHSSVEAAIMYSGIPAGVTKNLHADDIQGIKALYNV